MAAYRCQHHNEDHKTHADIALMVCGCNGTTHHACKRRPVAAGISRPVDWPESLAWPHMGDDDHEPCPYGNPNCEKPSKACDDCLRDIHPTPDYE